MKEKTECIIVDDDPYAAEILADYIDEFAGLELRKIYCNSLEALEELPLEREPRLIFLDIHMPNFSGMQLAQRLKHLGHHIIFTTAHPEFALKGYDVNARHFLLKPIDLARFAEVVSEVTAAIGKTNLDVEKGSESVFLSTGERGHLTHIKKKEIVYIQGSLNYVDIFLEKEKYCTYMTMKEMENFFSPEAGFYRVHRSYIINGQFILRIVGNMIDLVGHQVTMSRPYKDDFLRYLKENTLISDRRQR